MNRVNANYVIVPPHGCLTFEVTTPGAYRQVRSLHCNQTLSACLLHVTWQTSLLQKSVWFGPISFQILRFPLAALHNMTEARNATTCSWFLGTVHCREARAVRRCGLSCSAWCMLADISS